MSLFAIPGSQLVTAVIIPTGLDFTTSAELTTVYSGVKFDADGDIYARQPNGAYTQVGTWLVTGLASSFYLSRTIDDGTLTTDAGGGPLQMNTDREYDIRRSGVGTVTADVTFEISSDMSGSPVVAARTLFFSAEKESSN